MKCESRFCTVHRGQVRKVIVEDKQGQRHIFNYCDQAVVEDDWRGFRTWDYETGGRLGAEVSMCESHVLAEVEIAIDFYQQCRDCGDDKEKALGRVLDECHRRLRNQLNDTTRDTSFYRTPGGVRT